MKKFLLLSTFLVFSFSVFGQTPCGAISPLDCSQVGVSLPVDLDFEVGSGGIADTGFTMVDPPSSPLSTDESINDAVITGLIAGNLNLNGGALNVNATNGINFSQLSGSPSSTFTNSQMNALGMGFSIGANVIDVSATIDQPNFAGTTPNNGSQQAGIWLGLNENNFAKLVVVKASGTQQKIQLAVEQGDGVGNTTNLSIDELNTANFSVSGVSMITFRISIDPGTNEVTGFYSLNGGAEIQVGSSSLTAPASFLAGVDHDSNAATDALTYAGIMTSTRRATGGSMVISYDNFSVTEDVPVPPATITAPYRINVAGSEFVKNGDVFSAEDVSYLVERGSATTASTGSYTPNPGNTDLYFPRRFGDDFGYAFPIANGNYTVALHMVENFQDAPGIRIFDVSIEDNVVINDLDLFASYGKGQLALLNFDVVVTDELLEVDFDASANLAILQAIEILPVVQSDENDILTFTLAEQTGTATLGAGTVDIEVASGTNLTSLSPTITISTDATILPASDVAQDFTNPVVYTVTAEDGSTQDWTVTVTVAQPTNTAPSITSPSTAEIEENETTAIDVNASDTEDDASSTDLVYSLSGGEDVALFNIDGTTGVVSFQVAPDFEAPGDNGADNVYDIEVTVTDSGALTTIQDIAITVTEVNEAPEITSSTTAMVEENQTIAIDVDAIDDNDVEGPGLQYAIDADPLSDHTLFSIDPISGEVSFNDAPDFENPLDQNGDNTYVFSVTVTDSGALDASQSILVSVTDDTNETPSGSFSVIENFNYAPGPLKSASAGAWDPEDNNNGTDKPDAEVVADAVAGDSPNSVRIENLNTTIDYMTLVNNPVELTAGVPFYYGTYFKFSEISTATNSPRVRVAIRVDDDTPENEHWVRQIVGRYGGELKARLGLAGSNSNAGQQDVYPDQLYQFVVKGVWDGTGTVTYEYTLNPTLTETGNTWIAASASQAVSGTPKLGRIFMSSTNQENAGNIGPIRLSTEYTEVVSELVDSDPFASFSSSISDLQVEFDASTSQDDNSIASYSWDFGDGNSGSGASPSHTYSEGGTFTVELTVTDDGGNTSVITEDITVEAPFVATFPYQINFQDEATTPPNGYLKDFGEAYGPKDGELTYGWIKLSDGLPIDLTSPNNGTGRNREVAGVDLLLNTLVHVQGNDVGWTGNRGNEGVWEIAVDNGWYEVTVGVGDPDDDNNNQANSPIHYIDVEGQTAIPLFVVDFNLPEGDPGRFQANTIIVEVTDGKLTIDADDDGAFRTKINYATIAQATDPRSMETDILTFTLLEDPATAVIDTDNHTVMIEVANGVDLTSLTPTITLSDGATIEPDSGISQDFNAPFQYTVTAENLTTTQVWEVSITAADPLNETPVVDDQTFAIAEDVVPNTSVGTVVATDDGTISYAITEGNDGGEFDIDSDTGEITTLLALDFETTEQYLLTVEVSDGELSDTAQITIDVTDVVESEPFTAFINFQNNPSATPPPAGYLPDYGREFGFSSITVNGTAYDYGWRLLETDEPWNASEEAANNSTGVGRLRLSNVATYNAASLQEKLEGTLVHFQGDNIAGWGDGQPRKNELYWELEIPNGIYEVTLGLGDKAANNVDSRHTATLEGYTIIPAFRPTSTETRVATMIVEVTDGALTMNGLGGFNSKITHIEVVESTEAPVNGILAFAPDTASENLEAGTSGSFESTLSGNGATGIALNIEDDPVNVTADNFNDWLSLPTTDVPGEFVFGMDASALVATDTRNNRIIATAAGFAPAILNANLTVTEGAPNTLAFIEDFDAYTPSTGDLVTLSNGDWVKQAGDEGLAGIPVIEEGLTPSTTHSLEINSSSAIAVHDFQKLIDAPVSLEADVPFYFGTYFKITELGGNNGNRIRVAVRVDDDGGVAGAGWVRHIIGNYGGTYFARLGLGGSNSNMGQTEIAPDQLLQFVVKGIWDGTDTINYEYTIAPTAAEGDNTWIPALESQTTTGIPSLARIFISSTRTANDGKIGPIRLSTDYTEVVTEEIIEEALPCSPLTILPCDQIVTDTPIDFNFDGTQGGLNNTGFTMVDPYSGTRVPEDGAPTNINLPSYEPANLTLTNDNLVITANKGIAYLNNNAQINTLGVGLQDINTTLTIETKLLNIVTGNGSAQAGLWFGIDDENFVKLNVNNNNIELRREIAGTSVNGAGTPDQIQVDAGASGEDVTLRIVIDPTASTITAFYSFDDTNFTQLVKTNFDNLELPEAYLNGILIDAEVGSASFAGVYATHRNNANSFDAVFDYFSVTREAVPLALSFDVNELSFSGEEGELIASQTATVSATSGTPTFKLSDDPDSNTWLILPEGTVTLPDNSLAFPLGEIEFGIQEGLPAGTYSTTIFATDEPDLGYENAELTISLEITEPIDDFAVNINFSDPATAAPNGYEKDSGDAYGERGNGFSYGWLDANSSVDADLTNNGRNRGRGVTVLENTLIHMQYGDVSNDPSRGYLPDAKWEIDVPNGSYLVTVFVGDPDIDGDPADTPRHRINVEGINLIDDFVPTGAVGESTRFTSGSATVVVTDGRLTLDPLGGDGFNTKIGSVQIVASTGGVQTPSVLAVTPTDGATGVSVNTSISANELFLPNLDGSGNTGVDNSTITNSTVKLFKQGNPVQIGATVNGTGGGDAISLVPNLPLEANTTYDFEIDGVQDTTGEPFAFFTSSFTTGGGGGGPTTDLDNVSFNNEGTVASGAKYATLEIGPDGKLYGLEIDGDIHRWDINTDGTLANEEILTAWKSGYGSRAAIGFAFDPDATPTNLIAYITHQSGALNNAPSWDGKISRLTGASLENEDLVVTNLPRSKKDHLTNSIAFRPSEPNVLYFNQGSNSAAGAPDNAWGNRKERLLSAATLKLDLDKLPENEWPLNAKTTMDPVAINSVNVNSPTLTSTVANYMEDGQTFPDDGTYNPYYINAPLTLYATGVRNAYDLAWHSNGQLYIPTNGTAGGSNAPASIDGTRRPDGTFYNHSNPIYPVIPASNGNNTQRDWLFRVDPNSGIGYYGHPNPLRGEFVLNRGDADVNNGVYDNIQADANYRGAAFDFEFNKSPNGVIEYRSNAENGNLQGALLVVRYSGGSDIIALVPDGPNGDIDTFKVGIQGFTGFQDPLDLIEDVSTGNIYVSDYGRSEIVLLKPSNQSSPQPLILVGNEDFTGDAETSGTNTYSEEITISNLGNGILENLSAQITGTDADQFAFSGLPTTIASQNSGSFTISFDPTSNGPKFAQLTLSGTDADPVVISLSGLGKTGTGGSNEPSLQWILDTHLGQGVVNVGDTDSATNIIDLPTSSTYNDLLGDEVDVQRFERAIDAPITLEVLSVYGPESANPIVAFGWYESGNASATNELFTVENATAGNGQTLNPVTNGILEFDPGTQSFGFYNQWPFFSNRQLFSEDILNTFSGAIPHHIRVYELPGEENAYIIATEEHIEGFDYQDIVVVARNVRPFDDTPALACSPISTLECEEIEVSLPFTLNFDGTEGGLSNTGFTMVDDPSARITEDGAISNPDVPGYEPNQLRFDNGNLVITANNGIAYRTNGTTNTQSTEVNSQINTLGVGFDADSFGNFSIETVLINPYSDGTTNSEQGGLWFGLDEDNFVKLNATNGGQVELRSELGGLSGDADKIGATNIAGLHTSTVGLRLYIDVENDLMTAFYTLNGGVEVEVGSLPLPALYLNGNSDHENLSFAGIYASKRRELTANVEYTFESFAIVPENIVAFEPININFSREVDPVPTGYLQDAGLGYADRGNDYSYGWLTTDGNTPLDLSNRTRNREVDGVSLLQNTLVHMQFQVVDPLTGVEGMWEIEVPNGTYNVNVTVGDPNVDGQAGTEPFHSINVEGVSLIDRYEAVGPQGAATRFTSASGTFTVTDGRLTIDAFGGTNTKINAVEISQDAVSGQPFFANANPADNATNVAITDFQINVEVIAPEGYELDETTIGGNVNLYRLDGTTEILVPSNSNDTGGGDAITLTPLSDLQPFTTYVLRLTSTIEANRIGDVNDRLSFQPFRSEFTTGDGTTVPDLDLTGVTFTQVALPTTQGERFSSLVIGPDGKLYGSTIGDFNSDGKIYRWDMAADGTLENEEILTPELQGSPNPEGGSRPATNNERLIIGFAFDPAATADNLIAYVTHSEASDSDGPEWDGKLTRLSGPNLDEVQDIIEHLPRSKKDHLTNSIIFNEDGDLFINQGSNSAGGEPDVNWAFRPERLLSAAILKLEFDKLPNNLPLSAYTTDDIGVINAAPNNNIVMSNGTYNPYAVNSPLTIFASGVRNAYDFVWHTNGWLYIPTNGTAGNNNSSPNSPSTANYPLARRIDGLTTIPDVPALLGGETQKDWLFKTQGGSYHGHPNPFRGEFVLNHGGAPYSGVPGQESEPATDVSKYPNDLGPDPNYREPAYDFGFNKSPNGAIEYQSDAFGGKLQGLLMVVRFSGQDDIIVLQPQGNGDIANANGDVPGLQGFDDPLDLVEDPLTGNIYVSEYDRGGNTNVGLTLLRADIPATQGPEIAAAPGELIFETTVNTEGNQTDTKTVEVLNEGNEVLNITSASVTGDFADQFEDVQPSGTVTVNPGESQTYTVTYAPDLNSSDLGHQEANLSIASDDAENPTFEIGLHALKKAGFEGGEEPWLQDVVDALGIGIDVGWNSLSNGTNAAPVGDEVAIDLWIKSGNEPVQITPVGRYSPAEEIPFGWFTNDSGTITLNEVGVLANGLPNAQTLFPPLESGSDEFDPEGAVFGLYTDSNVFSRTNYTEDAINTGVAHRTRIYPNKDRDGNIIENSYLVAFEDATNGDYQDYMFVIDNVIPFEDGILALDFDKESLDFIASINQEDVPVQQLRLSGNGGITAQGINLQASEDWVVLPDVFELNTSFDIGVDITGLAIGSYQATVIASAPNYEDAVVNVVLEITNELVYTYQFNFQTPDDVEVSPDGYIDDLGVPYGVQNTALGDLTYGWVLPGTLTPADAAVNGRNRDSGIPDGVLLQTFTIIGHPNPGTYPQRDWVVNVPNGTYSVNISVGERDFLNSNHVLDVNGTTVLSFDQENNNPENLIYFEDTKFVEVTEGTLRMSLGTGGYNAKPNYIRLAPINTSLLPPTIVATFDGNISAPNNYRGTVSIGLEATDNSESGGIARLEYVLDGNPTEDYSEPITVSDIGAHSLVVTAEDNNGNISEKAFEFTIEPATGALLALENMTKVPGTDRGFPADDYYTFHRLGNPGQAAVHDSNVMRLNNTGTGDLIVTGAVLSDTNDYEFEVLDNAGATVLFPISIAPGSFADLDITFIATTGNGNNGIFVEDIEIVSNADNALENKAVLHGAYSPQPEGGDEIHAQEVFDAFGFQSSMLSIVNDEGTITPPNNITFRPSSNFPDPENIDAGYEGDMILSPTFVQADPSKPVIGIQLSALHGGPGSNGAKFVAVDGTGTVGGMNFSHDPAYYQTLLPKSGANINFDTAATINGPFRIAVANYLSSGGNNINGNRPDLLGLRIYKVIDHNGNIIPNEYIVLQDFVQGGCGAGSANCDWNDNTFYFINIRPEAVPSAEPAEAYFANVGETFDLDIEQYFDKGYPGNKLTVSASVDGGALPVWLSYNTLTGMLIGTPPLNSTGSLDVVFDAVDTNGLTASTTLMITFNEPPVAVDDEVSTTQNVAILLDGLLANDSEPNGQDITIVTVDNPLNGEAVLQADGVSILYTPGTDFVGTDSFTYTIEDETGLTASANVVITVNEENQPPTALIVASTLEGEAALFVEFTGSGSTDENPSTLQYAWDFGDGIGSSNDPDTSYTFTSAGTYTISLKVTDGENLFDIATTTITVSSPPNAAPTAVAAATPLNVTNSLQFGFDASGSTDENPATLLYAWDFGDGNTSSDESPNHTYAVAGTYNVTLTVTDDGSLMDSTNLAVVAGGSTTGDFALRINAGGPELVHDGEVFEADQNFVGGKVYENASAQVPVLYQTERSADPPTFGYDIPLENGNYQITLHFAEIYWGATGGGTGGVGSRIFDVSIEGDTVLDDYDINADVGPQTVVTKTFDISLIDGVLNMTFDAAGSDGVNQPKLSAIEIVNIVDDCMLPDGWVSSDVGNVAADGEACFTGGQFEVSASGADIWGSADEFHYVYRTLDGDGEIIAQVIGLEQSDDWAKAGVMMRNDLDANSALAQMIIAPDPNSIGGAGHSFQHRPTKGATMGGGNFTTPTLVAGGLPHYVRLVRSGSTFTGYVSETNGNWAEIGSVNINMNETIFVGLATTSHEDGTLTNAVYENVSVNEEALNEVPTALALAQPLEGKAPLNVSFDGTDSEDDKGVVSYTWDFMDGTPVANGAEVDHVFTTAGIFEVELTVADAEGETDTDIVTITVGEPNVGPTASFVADPLGGEAPLLVNFDASGSTDDTEVVSYTWDFKDGNTSTGVNTTNTFDLPGVYEVSLVVSDEEGETDESTLTITVDEPTVVDFALRINAGGPELVHNGQTFSADQNFVGGKSYTNTSATVPILYQTERSAQPPSFGYEIPLANGSYQVTLHFAEIFWNAAGGKSGGVGSRIFDVMMEGNTILNDYDIIADVGSQTIVTKTFDIDVTDGVLNIAFDAEGSDGKNEPKLSAIEIFSFGTVNEAPSAVASALPLTGVAPLEVSFNSSGSSDDKEVVSYLWDFQDGTTSTDESPVHTFDTPGSYAVSLTVSDEEGETDEALVTITVEEPIVNDFELRINAGGPEITHNGKLFSADQNFVGGKSYANVNATVPELYQTERSASPPTFAYDIPLSNGNYQIALHFAEIYWGATGGSAGGTGKRVFDVTMEGNTILNDYDINADVGPQALEIKTFNVMITDGELNLVFDAAGSDGIDQPKLSAIEVLGVGTNQVAPIVDAGDDIEITLPVNSITAIGSGSDPDGGTISYSWSQINGPQNAILVNASSPELTANGLVAGSYTFRLAVTDDENVTAFDDVMVTVLPEGISNNFALRINAGGGNISYNGNEFTADEYFDTGSTLDRPQTGLPEPFQSFRFSRPQQMSYDIPIPDGEYVVNLYFAELWFGATGGGVGGVGKRVFDVNIEGQLSEDDLDIFSEVGADAMLIKTHIVNVTDGVLNIDFNSTDAVGGERHPVINAIEVLGIEGVSLQPLADAGSNIEVILPTNGFTVLGNGIDPDGGLVTYQWTQVSGPDTAILMNTEMPELTAVVLVEGEYVFRLTVTDDEGEIASDDVIVTAANSVQEEVWLEAECATVGSGWSVVNDANTSGGQYLEAPPGFNSSTSMIGDAIITFDFSIEAGTYSVFGLVRTPSGTEDSFWVRVNGGPWVRWNSIPPSNDFEWHTIHFNEQLSQPRVFEFAEGVNRIELGHRESGVGIDKLYITKTGGQPSGLGGSATNCGGSGKSIADNTVSNISSNASDSELEMSRQKIQNSVSLFPNAADARTKVTFTNPEVDITVLYVHDVSGRLVGTYDGQQLKTNSGNYELEVSNLENGVYLIRMAMTDGDIFDRKLIVRH